MEEKERKVSVERKSSVSASDGESAPTESKNINGAVAGVRGTTGGLAGIARMLGSKAKGQDGPQNGAGGGSKRQKGCEDDLPLGSEAHSIGTSNQNYHSGHHEAVDKQSKMIGWQSFNSDVSNQTSASSASLEMLLNERQVDPEEVLLNLGFGLEREGFVPSLARIPERFLHHPTRASGIFIPGLADDMEPGVMEEEEDKETGTSVTPSTGVVSPATSAPPARKKPGIWTLARTLSMLRMKTPLSRAGHMSPSRTPPLAHQPASILLPINQKYLASKGYYRQQGWPKGTFEDAEEEHTQEEKDDWKDAATRRRKFQKTKSKRHWSLCGSNENVNELPTEDRDWVSKSMDDSINGDLSRSRNDSRGTCFSTNTESSTDSLDTPNPETERAFEEIRRQYNESLARKQSSEDLFLPVRYKKRNSSDLIGHNLEEDNESDHGLDLLSTNDNHSNNYFISPASSRQATVEKAPTLSEQTNSINIDDVDGGNRQKDGNNNRNKYSSSDRRPNEKSTSIGQDFYDDLDKENCSDVRIIVSSSDSGVVKRWTNSLTHDAFGMKSPTKLTVKTIQRASSDSGSTSSSGTAIGSCSIATTTDDLDTLRLSESEVTDRDSLSGANSPYSFSQRLKQMTASSCQTCDDDFRMAAAVYQNVSVSTISSGNISVRNARIQHVGVRDSKQTPDMKGPRLKGRGELIHLEDGPRVQLSSLPPTINPLELMKRLRHSQADSFGMGQVFSSSAASELDNLSQCERAHSVPVGIRYGTSCVNDMTICVQETDNPLSGPQKDKSINETIFVDVEGDMTHWTPLHRKFELKTSNRVPEHDVCCCQHMCSFHQEHQGSATMCHRRNGRLSLKKVVSGETNKDNCNTKENCLTRVELMPTSCIPAVRRSHSEADSLGSEFVTDRSNRLRLCMRGTNPDCSKTIQIPEVCKWHPPSSRKDQKYTVQCWDDLKTSQSCAESDHSGDLITCSPYPLCWFGPRCHCFVCCKQCERTSGPEKVGWHHQPDSFFLDLTSCQTHNGMTGVSGHSIPVVQQPGQCAINLFKYELTRMGSVQSDSSGFGDTDLAADAGNVETDFLKVASLGSSSESCTTTATLQGPSKGEMATQTSVDSVRGNKVNVKSIEDKSQQQSTKPETGSTHYVTMCYIPSLASKAEHSEIGLPGATNTYPNGPRSRVASDAGSETRRAFHDSYDRIGFTRPRGNSDVHLNYGSHGRHYSSVRTYAESISDSPRMYFSHDTGQRRARNNDSPLRRNLAHVLPGRTVKPDSSPQLSQRKFTSNLDLFTNESGLHSRGEMSYLSHTPLAQRRRHSDEGLLSDRNDTPLSVELAQAVASLQSSASETIPPSTTVSSSVYIQPSVNTVHGRQGLHFPTLAGNLSKLTTDLHSTPVESRINRNPPRQRSCDILDDDFSVSDGDLNPTYTRSETGSPHLYQSPMEGYPGSDSSMLSRRMTSSWQRQSSNAYSEDLDSYSSMAESSSDFSVHSSPEGHPTSGVLDSRKLARLINQPVFFKGKRRTVCHYRPWRIFKEWTFLSKRKRLQEENRLLQYAIQKYKTDLSIMETSFRVDYQTVYADMTNEEREEIEELEWLWSEVKGQVMEMEQLLTARIKSVHGGNDFHSLMSSMGIINRMIELIKEQIYLQQVANSRVEDVRDDQSADDLDGLYSDDMNYDRRHSSFQGGFSRLSSSTSHPPPVRRTQSSSMSNLPNDLNISLEQIKSSLLSQVQIEIKESTKKLESDLKEKDKEIQLLKDQMAKAVDTPAKPIRRWTPKSMRSRSFTSGQSAEGSPLARSQRSRLVGDRVVQETDV